MLASSASAQDKPAPAPEAEAPKKKAKKKKKKAEAKEPERPKDAPPPTEATVIEPNVLYRLGKLLPRNHSAYHRPEHSDYFDQLYLTLKFQKTYDYVHQVVIEPSIRTQRENPDDLEYFIEQAYVESAAGKRFSFTAGKKTEFEGAGFIVNPSDLLNEDKDILDQVYQKEGVVFTRARVRVADFNLGLGIIPISALPTTAGRAWLTVNGEIKEVELRLQVTHNETEKTATGLSIARFIGEHFELHFDGNYRSRQRSQRSRKELSYLTYSSYTIKNEDNQVIDSEGSGYYLAGSRIILTPRRTIVIEAITQQSGLLPDQFKLYFDYYRNERDNGRFGMTPPTRLIGRHYAFFSLQDDDSLPSTHLSANFLMNTDDQSKFIVFSARNALSEVTSVELSPTFFLGEVDSEYGEMPFQQAVYLIFRGRF